MKSIEEHLFHTITKFVQSCSVAFVVLALQIDRLSRLLTRFSVFRIEQQLLEKNVTSSLCIRGNTVCNNKKMVEIQNFLSFH